MRQAVVFYEFQVPFGFTGYLRNIPASETNSRLPRYLPDSFSLWPQRFKTALTVMQTASITGEVLQGK